MRQRILLAALALVLPIAAIQFIPVHLPANDPKPSIDLLGTEGVPDGVARLLREGCYDCHSQQVRYPWYAFVAPVSWLVSRDVAKGREQLDFSQWAALNKRKQIAHLNDIAEQVEAEEMPLPIYMTMHPEARFTPEQRRQLVEWTEGMASKILGD